jgi:hypothetical protein
MSKEIDIVIIFDPSAILASRTRDWSLFDQIGTCFIPQVVMDEINFLCKRASEPDEEKTAREFTRFIVDSTWELTEKLAEHPSLNPPSDEDLSKNAWLQQAISQSMYALALENQNKLVICISNKQTLRNNLDELKLKNLCTLPLAQFIQWIRTKQVPLNINQQKQKMMGKEISKTVSSSPTSNSTFATKTTNKSSNSTLNNHNFQAKNNARIPKKSNFIGHLISYIFAFLGFTLVGLFIWNFTQPDSFNKFWEKTGLPSLPNNIN